MTDRSHGQTIRHSLGEPLPHQQTVEMPILTHPIFSIEVAFNTA